MPEDITKEKLEELIYKENLKDNQIAEYFGVSQPKITGLRKKI